MIGEVTLPFQSNGSLFTLDDKVIGSKLIAQEFASDKLFHPRPTANSTSGVDPHITPEEAFSQVPRISRATGLEVNTLKTIIQLDIERNKVSNMLVFAPLYMNVLQVNLDLITGYPKIYQEFTANYKRGEIDGVYFGWIYLIMLVSAGALTYSLVKAEK